MNVENDGVLSPDCGYSAEDIQQTYAANPEFPGFAVAFAESNRPTSAPLNNGAASHSGDHFTVAQPTVAYQGMAILRPQSVSETSR